MMTAEQIASLQPALCALIQRFRPHFNRQATFNHFQCYLLGLMASLKRKSIEPIALAAGTAVRSLQEFLAFFVWDHRRVNDQLQRMVADEHGGANARGGLGVLDASGHAKSGHKTPGVQRQYCGETGKLDNCVVGQHLLYTDNDAENPFCCVLASDLFLPKSWDDDRERCREAHIPDHVTHRAKWRIGLDQVKDAIGNGVRFEWLTFDEDYGKVPAFWFELDQLGQRGIGEVPSNFLCWANPPKYRSLRKECAASEVRHLYRHSPAFTSQPWREMKVKDSTRGPVVWQIKHARVHLVDTSHKDALGSHPTDRTYGLIVARNVRTYEIKYFVSNAAAGVSLEELMVTAFGRWHIEQWFQRAKQECGFGAFEVRTYTSLIRHWLCSRLVMYFLAAQTQRLRGEKPADHPGTNRGRGQHVSREDMEELVGVMG
jgi:SRSO17 transposase